MTDKEIIKALECCISNEDCSFCPLFRNCPTSLDLQKQALDLINRQQAEIENIVKNNISTKYPNHVLNSKGVILTKTLEDYDELINDISLEAIKEFAERLKAETKGFAWCKFR